MTPRLMTIVHGTLVFFCALVLLLTTAKSQSGTSKEQYIDTYYVLPDEFWKDVERLENLGKQKNLKEVQSYSESLVKKWESKGTPYNFTLAERICAVLSSYKYEDDRQRLATLVSYAERALLDTSKIPVSIEVTLVTYLAQETSLAKARKAADWSAWRSKRAKLWLHIVQRIEKGIDKNYTPGTLSSLPHMSTMPPGGGISGIDPTDVNDPKARAKYEAVIEENRQKNLKLSEQMELRRLEKRFMPVAERYLINIYSTAPQNVTELKKYLDSYAIDEQRKSKILNAVAKANQRTT